jgi:N-acetylmuramoyl-L-alanine amidase
VAGYSGATSATAARAYADSVFRALSTGAALTTADGQALRLPATAGLRPDRAQLASLHLKAASTASTATTDCPAVLACTFTPAAYQQDSSDPGNYGNYDTAGRPNSMVTPGGQPASMKIRYIVIHDTEGSYASTISTFQNPTAYVSANYVIRSTDGAVTEMVRPANVAW